MKRSDSLSVFSQFPLVEGGENRQSSCSASLQIVKRFLLFGRTGMGKVSGLINVLTNDEMELIHNSALRVLAEVGMRIEHDEALHTLDAAGCHIDFRKQEVRFPPHVVENAIGRLRKVCIT